MKKQALVVFVGYVWTKMLLGITFYPNKYVRTIIHRPVLLPVVISPLIGILILLLTAKVGSYFFTITGWFREAVALFLSTTFISILFWQVLLFYLLLSYLFALWKKA